MKPYYQDKLTTIYYGDCNEVIPLLPVGSAKLVIADPPYGINYKSGRRQISFDFIEGDKTYPANWLKAIQSITGDSATLYNFCNDKSLDVAREALHQSKFELRKTLIWDKMVVTAGDLSNYGDRVEYILFANKKYKPALNGSRDGNIISIPRVHPPSLRHPTEKPELLMSYLVMKSTDPGELVLDPFMGVGPVLVAAKKLGRRVIGIEKNEQYCEVAANDLRHSNFYGNLTSISSRITTAAVNQPNTAGGTGS
jgi:site-specific DNA-methyltransferase (adenine-specific)